MFFHEVRTRQLKMLPYAGPTILSPGCAATWYFDWVRSCYSGPIDTHIGIEAFSPKPADLPAEALWIPDEVYDMKSVGDGSVDQVIAGQVVEHMWPKEFAGFLCEAHRVLRPGGRLMMDSPNREITIPLKWSMREHTVEYTVGEIRELVDLAGFDNISVVGMWQCRKNGALLPLAVPSSQAETDARLRDAASCPEDSFCWWVEAARSPRGPKQTEVFAKLQSIYRSVRRPQLETLFRHNSGRHCTSGTAQYIDAAAGESGHIHYGPYLPFPPGLHEVRIRISSPAPVKSDSTACILDITDDSGVTFLSTCRIRCSDLDEIPRVWILPLRLGRTRFGMEYRVLTTGEVPVRLELPLQVLTLESDVVPTDCAAAESAR